MVPFVSLLLLSTLNVEIRNSEVWVNDEGQAKQLTHDRRSKLEVLLSPAEDKIAYYEQCPQAEHCTPSVVVLDLKGRQMAKFQPAGNCASILSIAWAGNDSIAAECHINPSLSEYIETSLATGETHRDLFGYGFTPSPNGKLVAHAGWIVHFAPPYAQSNYLQLDNTIIYPLPQGKKPIAQVGLDPPPTVVKQNGLTYSGIHEFLPGITWSPDSRNVALVDCTYDWTARKEGSTSAGDGDESNRVCAVVIVSPTGMFALLPLTGIPDSEIRKARLTWRDSRALSIQVAGTTRTVSAP